MITLKYQNLILLEDISQPVSYNDQIQFEKLYFFSFSILKKHFKINISSAFTVKKIFFMFKFNDCGYQIFIV